jgi:hypothetical protein
MFVLKERTEQHLRFSGPKLQVMHRGWRGRFRQVRGEMRQITTVYPEIGLLVTAKNGLERRKFIHSRSASRPYFLHVVMSHLSKSTGLSHVK